MSGVQGAGETNDSTFIRRKRARLVSEEKSKEDEKHEALTQCDRGGERLSGVTDDEAGGTAIDSGRRGLLLDFDLLTHNYDQRRRAAWTRVLAWLEVDIADDQDNWVEEALLDLSDDTASRFVLARAGKDDAGEEEVDAVLERLDQEMACERPNLNEDLAEQLKQVVTVEGFQLAVLHRGSRQRMAAEISTLGLDHTVFARSKATIGFDCHPPYVERWRDIAEQIRCPPRQAVILCGVHGSKLLSHGIASSLILGCHCISLTEEHTFDTTMLRSLRFPHPPPVAPRLVLAQFSMDNSWYVGWASCIDYAASGGCWVTWEKYNNREWVPSGRWVYMAPEGLSWFRERGFLGVEHSQEARAFVID
mmetsp:Transcript_8704/g.17662  ORF Transcript_8704/g.17662 Transcript_8704/m.17662 type:complete len:363 (-) Transcript_8704:1320-2408(-)